MTPATLSWGCGAGFPVPWATRNGPNESVGNAMFLCGPPSGHGKMPSIAMMPPSSSIPMTAMARAEPFLGTARVSIRRTGAVAPATARLILDKGGLKDLGSATTRRNFRPALGEAPSAAKGVHLRRTIAPVSKAGSPRRPGDWIQRSRLDEPRNRGVHGATWAHGPAHRLQPAQHIPGAQISRHL